MPTLAEKLIASHLVEGSLEPGNEISIKIDHTLIPDSTGTLADLEFEAIGIPRVRTELSVSFADHNTLQNDFRNMDDHRFLQSFASKFGLIFSLPGNGICHQVFLERFTQPGKTLLGGDSHTTTSGGAGCLSLGAGGLDVAAAMAGEPYYFIMPEVVGVELHGRLQPFVSAKDIILEILKRIDVKGGQEKILEYYGSGVDTLSVTERGTITNMGTETGAVTSIFPSDNETLKFLKAQGRENAWVELHADEEEYSETISIDLENLEPLIALPHSPGNIKKVRDVEGIPINQVCIGSCTNSSLRDLKIVAQILKNKKIDKKTSLTISPGSRQVLSHITKSGELLYLLDSGARLLECTCGPCIGMGQAPCTNGVSLRTFNRNFKGRSGTESASVYLVSPETAVVSAINGKITDPRDLIEYPKIKIPDKYIINDSFLVYPSKQPEHIKIIRGPNIKPLPEFNPLSPEINGEVLIMVGDNITTDHILPAGAEILPLRSNIPEISKYVFHKIDSTFYDRAIKSKGGIIVGGTNYGQGSSREHAALAPKILGIKAVIAKSFSRIHESNLVNFGIFPLIFRDQNDIENISLGDILKIEASNLENIIVINTNTNSRMLVTHNLSDRNLQILSAGGKLPYIKKKSRKSNE